MAALAEAADVATELGLSGVGGLTDVQVIRIPSLLIKASAAFRREAGHRQFTAGTYTQRLQVVDGCVRLLEAPVTSVATVVDDSGNTVAYTRVGDWLKVSGHHRNVDNSFTFFRPPDIGSGWFVTATYVGGAVPDEVRITVAQIVARALRTDPAAATGVKSLDSSMGPFAARKQFFDWAAETVTLTEEECALAQSFVYPRTALVLHHERRGGFWPTRPMADDYGF